MTQNPIRYYVVCKADQGLKPGYFDPDIERANEWAKQYITNHVYERPMADPPFKIRARPSAQVSSTQVSSARVSSAQVSSAQVLSGSEQVDADKLLELVV